MGPEMVHHDKPPPTDSGYASAFNVDHLPPGLSSAAPTPVQTAAAEYDAITVYTSAASFMAKDAQKSIIDVCNDVKEKVGSHMMEESWSAVSSLLCGLLKAFAIRIGSSQAANEKERRIMSFLHRRNQ